MFKNEVLCRVKHSEWISSSVLRIRFEPSTPFRYDPGQFITIGTEESQQPAERRCYSLASSYEEARVRGYEILVKVIPDGKGTQYLAKLKRGDRLMVAGPFGDFHFRKPSHENGVVFITSGTGIAPVRAILGSPEFAALEPTAVTLLHGARNEAELALLKSLEAIPSLEILTCLTHPEHLTEGMWGRVTDYLEKNPKNWDWKNLEYYVVGGERMVNDVLYHLKFRRGVSPTQIHTENFRPYLLNPPLEKTEIEERSPAESIFPELFSKKKTA